MSVFGQQQAFQQLQALGADVRLVLIHPNFTQQHVILPALLERALYVRFHGTALTSDMLHAQLSQAAAHLTGSTDIQGYRAVILDEGDRAQPPHLDTFLQNLLTTGLPRIYVFSRAVPPLVLVDEAVRKITRMLPTSESLMLWDYAQRSDSSGILLEVRALGDGRVQLNSQPIQSWDGLLPRMLFFFLVDRGMVTRNEIFETFWPNLTVREATNVFHVTKRKISEVLGADLTVYWSGFYHISPRIHLSYDAIAFTQLMQDSSVMSLEESARLVRLAVDLYRGDFLASIDMPWAERRRQDLRQMYGEALVTLAKATEYAGDLRGALGLFLRASTVHVQREDLAHHIMRLYMALGMPDDALARYQRLERDLRQSLNLAPGKQLQEYAATIASAAGSGA
ncbi:MAG: BTAD domain-containing putative transcriptional regulator [bacterium]|nr:BTAD domain-containing putative transcriptional regulator [bacterium]